jgi:hypothetical protein
MTLTKRLAPFAAWRSFTRILECQRFSVSEFAFELSPGP